MMQNETEKKRIFCLKTKKDSAEYDKAFYCYF